jgi:hypothetical protein
MDALHPTTHSLRYRETAAAAWADVLQPHLAEHRPELLDRCCYAVGSSVAYGLADEYSDLDTVLVVPEEEFEARRDEWVSWAYRNPALLAFGARHDVTLNVKVTTWRRAGAAVLLYGEGDWQTYYEGSHHHLSTLIPIHDPCGYGSRLRNAIASMPPGLAQAAAARLESELASLAADFRRLQHAPRFAGLFAYSVGQRALPLLFHRAGAPLPFHKWQWPLAERLGAEAAPVLASLQRLLEQQFAGDQPFPPGLAPSGAVPRPWRVPRLPVGGPLPAEFVTQALASVQWHLEERGSYQMVRALARGWRHAALHYLCATRCLLIKGLVLTETGRLVMGPELPEAWAGVRASVADLDHCLWPDADPDPIAKALEGIGLFRAHLRARRALPGQHLDRPLWSPPSYELACVLEEP